MKARSRLTSDVRCEYILEWREQTQLKDGDIGWVSLAARPDGETEGLKQVVVEVGLARVLVRKRGTMSSNGLHESSSVLVVDRNIV